MSYFSVVAQFQFAGAEDQFNVHYFEFPEYIPTAPQIQEAIDGIDDAYKLLQTRFAADVDLLGYDVRRIDVANLPSAIYTPTAGLWSGTAAGASLPSFCSVLVTFRSFTTYPRTARTYLPSFAVGSSAAQGAVSSAAITQVAGWATAIQIQPISGANDVIKQTVRFTTGTNRIVDLANDLTSYTIASEYSPLSKRKRGEGS